MTVETKIIADSRWIDHEWIDENGIKRFRHEMSRRNSHEQALIDLKNIGF